MPSEAKPHNVVVVSDINAEHSASKDTVLDTVDAVLAEKSEDKNTTTDTNDPVEPVAESTPVKVSVRKRINTNDPLYEVIVDTWGSKPAYHRGALVRRSNCKNNLARAIAKNLVKLIREYDTPEVD